MKQGNSNAKPSISNTPDGLLVRIKDKILLSLNVDLYKLKYLIDNFVSNNFEGINNSKVHFAKVNIFNEFTKNKMTIKVFFKFLHILRIKNIKFIITVTTVENKEVTITEEVIISHYLVEGEGDNDEK